MIIPGDHQRVPAQDTSKVITPGQIGQRLLGVVGESGAGKSMTGNAVMGALNWVPKWFHGDATVAAQVLAEFPGILSAGLAR